MATMLKEKRRGKKKTKEKSRSSYLGDEASSSIENSTNTKIIEKDDETSANVYDIFDASSLALIRHDHQDASVEQHTSPQEDVLSNEANNRATCSKNLSTNTSRKTVEVDSFKNLNAKLERMAIPDKSMEIDEAAMLEIEHIDAYLQSKQNEILKESHSIPELTQTLESVVPTAPLFHEPTVPQTQTCLEDNITQIQKPKVECLTLDEAIRLSGGKEMAFVKEMSDGQEAEVEAGPNLGPEYPLIDLLSTFRSSIRAMECERTRLASNFDDEKKYRDTLWKVEKQKLHLSMQCKCGVNVDLKATYEQAQLMKEKLPVAKLKLEGFLKDVQELYCHHQHAALLAHCQIEDIVSETVQGSKGEIRDALSLILQSLRMSDGTSEALPAALQRWAEILACALIDERDLRQLLFVIHHLFRQTRSVRWAARVLHTRVSDNVTAARTLAVLDILLSKMHLEAATECVEETEGAWEEVDIRGGHGAVSSGALRERDLIALVRALPLQQLVSKLVMFSQADFRQATEYDWGDASGGSELLKACCGVRALVSILQRASSQHASYARLHAVLRDLACSALTALGCFYQSPSVPYLPELEERIKLELHSAFAASFSLFGTQELHKLPTTLLTENAAKDYCLTFIMGLHDTSPKSIVSLSVTAPVLACDVRIRIITQAAADRERDIELAKMVLDFLMQTGLKRRRVPCKVGCEPTARECVPILLTAHPYMRGIALRIFADISQVETLDPSMISVLDVSKWRPSVEEMQAMLGDWSQRCPTLLQHLLLQLDYTPHTGLSLPVQLDIGSWVCGYASSGQLPAEVGWRVLMRTRSHRACWSYLAASAPPPAPAPATPAPAPADLLSMAYAVLATDWGYSIPLICSHGVNAIFTLCATRPREAVHCLAPVMLMMAQSPESISLTPKFAELFTILISCGPNLVQRALGRGGASGSELLLRLVLSQVDMKQQCVFNAWLHALWKVPAALSILDIAALAVRDWYTMDLYAITLIQETNAKEHITNAVRFAFTSPLLCECLLRAAHAHEIKTKLFPALVTALSQQRAASQRIHVDNALQKINPNLYSEDLIVYRCASAALVAPFQHPSHLTLWRLFFHIYLQRPRDQPSSIPCGPLFFSGIIKSHALFYIKKRLSETAAHHHIEAESYKPQPNTTHQPINQVASPPAVDDSLLPALTIRDLTGETSDYDDSDSEGESAQSVAIDGSTEKAIEAERKKRNANMAAYHAGAEKMVREFIRWLDEGEKVQASQQNVDIAWFIQHQALEEAWTNTLSRCRPPPSPELDTFPRPEPVPPYNADVPQTPPLQAAVATILSIKCRSPVRTLRRIRSRTDEMDHKAVSNIHGLLTRVDELLKEIEKYAEEWSAEVARISSLDKKLWELVATLRAPRPLPPVKRQCTNKCQAITFHLNTQEWCISAGAERGIRDNRSASLTGIRRLTAARPRVARTAATLQSIARRTQCEEDAVKVLEMAWRCAGRCPPCTAAHAALTALFIQLAERWIAHNGELCHKLLSRGVEHNSSALQHALCGSLVAPRQLKDADWPNIYITVLQSSLSEHTVFSYLSRFELSRWKVSANASDRERMIRALLIAAQRPPADDCEGVLLELVGVHTALLATADDLLWLLEEAATLSASGGLLPSYWMYLNRAVEEHAADMSILNMNDVFRCLGTVWDGASPEFCERHATFAPYIAELLSILIGKFVEGCIKLSYTHLRTFEYVWVQLIMSFSPWIHPLTILPHPAPGSNHYCTMLKRFLCCIKQIINDLPDATSRVLEFVYVWSIDMWRNVREASAGAGAEASAGAVAGAGAAARERALASALLAQAARLPWSEHQWFSGYAFYHTSRIWQMDDEIASWCYERFVTTNMDGIMLSLQDPNTDSNMFLSYFLQVLCGNTCVTDQNLIKQACTLPWWFITELSLIQGLSVFLRVFCDSTKQYKDAPQATLLLFAAEFQPNPLYSARARIKRLSLINHWSNAYRNKEVLKHCPAYTEFMLTQITRWDPYVERIENIPSSVKPTLEETQELLSRLAMITLTLCDVNSDMFHQIQAVWVKWICHDAPKPMIHKVLEMSSRLTNLSHTGVVVDNAVRKYILIYEGGWRRMRQLWWCQVEQPWAYVDLGLLHAAYAATITDVCGSLAHSVLIIDKFHAITAAKAIDYFGANDEVMVAVWICYMARVVRNCDTTLKAMAADSNDPTIGNPTESEARECMEAAMSLLAIWAQDQQMSIIKKLTFQTEVDKPTPRHRILARLALCLQTQTPEAAKAYEKACAEYEGTISKDMIAWGRTPSPNMLPMLAGTLFPASKRFFNVELYMSSDDQEDGGSYMLD